ncbi:MAG TPA: hypothetical protein VIL36_11225 [Acidimicrobiales bacterium]
MPVTTARIRLALAAGLALVLAAAIYAGRPASEPIAAAAPSPVRPSIAALDAQRETSTHMTTGDGYPVRWAREDGVSPDEVRTIHFVLWGDSDPALVAAMDHGIRVWNDASPFVDLRLAAGECPEGRHCVLVSRQAGLNGAVTHIAADAEGRMSGQGAMIIFDADPWDPDLLENAACHEVGHALGLDHAPAEHVAGPCWRGRPTLHDRALVAEAYAWD